MNLSQCRSQTLQTYAYASKYRLHLETICKRATRQTIEINHLKHRIVTLSNE